jgi:hypothetical protein
MVKYIGVHAVFSLFNSLLADDDRLRVVHQWLVDIHIHDQLLQEFVSIDFDGYVCASGDPYSDNTFARATAVYHLINRMARQRLFHPYVLTPQWLNPLKLSFPNESPYVKAAHWKAIRSCCIEQSAPMMTSFLALAIAVLTEDTERLFEHQVVAIAFLSRMVAHVPEIVAAFGHLDIARWMLPLVLKFRSATILHQTVRDFCLTSLNNVDFAPKMIELYLPLLMEEVMDIDRNRVLRATLFDIIAKIKRIVDADPEFYTKVLAAVPDFKEFCKSVLAPYEEQKGMRYGGMQLGPMAGVLSGIFM